MLISFKQTNSHQVFQPGRLPFQYISSLHHLGTYLKNTLDKKLIRQLVMSLTLVSSPGFPFRFAFKVKHAGFF